MLSNFSTPELIIYGVMLLILTIFIVFYIIRKYIKKIKQTLLLFIELLAHYTIKRPKEKTINVGAKMQQCALETRPYVRNIGPHTFTLDKDFYLSVKLAKGYESRVVRIIYHGKTFEVKHEKRIYLSHFSIADLNLLKTDLPQGLKTAREFGQQTGTQHLYFKTH